MLLPLSPEINTLRFRERTCVHDGWSSNVMIVDGKAQFAVPFALNDARGAWRVKARDVVSGLAAERAITVK